jgi:uncharacterized membrane protein
MTLGFILIAIYSIGIKFANSEGTIMEIFTFNDIIHNRDNSVFTFYKTTYNLLVSALFFATLASAASLTVLILGFFTKDTKFVIPGMIVDFTVLILIVTAITLAIAGSALFADK